MRLYIIRHAEPDYENDTITPEGRFEAKALAERLSKHGLDRIYCSPLGRARHTMEYTSQLLGIEPVIEEWTEEIDLTVEQPPWGRLLFCDVPGEIIRSNDQYMDNKTWHKKEPFNSTEFQVKFESLKKYSDDFISRQGYERDGGCYRCLMPNRDKIAVFCHAGFGLTWLAHLLGVCPTLMWAGFWLPPSSVTTVLFDERSNEWAVPRCIGLGDISHLYKAQLSVKACGIKANFY